MAMTTARPAGALLACIIIQTPLLAIPSFIHHSIISP
jgi:hypothetical protein